MNSLKGLVLSALLVGFSNGALGADVIVTNLAAPSYRVELHWAENTSPGATAANRFAVGVVSSRGGTIFHDIPLPLDGQSRYLYAKAYDVSNGAQLMGFGSAPQHTRDSAKDIVFNLELTAAFGPTWVTTYNEYWHKTERDYGLPYAFILFALGALIAHLLIRAFRR